MKKNKLSLEEFLELDYKMIIEPYENIEYNEKGYVISCPDLPGIKVFGYSLEEALEELTEAKIAWFEMKEELDEEVFSPIRKEKTSGRLTLRLPINLHEKVQTFAEVNGTSLNNAINSLVVEGLHAIEMGSLKNAAIEEIKNQQMSAQQPIKTITVSDNSYSYGIIEEFRSARNFGLKAGMGQRKSESLYESGSATH